MAWHYIPPGQLLALQRILLLTSVDNEDVREMKQWVFGQIPELQLADVPSDDDDGTTVKALVCPLCGWQNKVGYDGSDGIEVLDMAVRASTFHLAENGSTIHGYYNDDYSFEGWGYECGHCGRQVRLPPGIDEEGD